MVVRYVASFVVKDCGSDGGANCGGSCESEFAMKYCAKVKQWVLV